MKEHYSLQPTCIHQRLSGKNDLGLVNSINFLIAERKRAETLERIYHWLGIENPSLARKISHYKDLEQNMYALKNLSIQNKIIK